MTIYISVLRFVKSCDMFSSYLLRWWNVRHILSRVPKPHPAVQRISGRRCLEGDEGARPPETFADSSRGEHLTEAAAPVNLPRRHVVDARGRILNDQLRSGHGLVT